MKLTIIADIANRRIRGYAFLRAYLSIHYTEIRHKTFNRST